MQPRNRHLLLIPGAYRISLIKPKRLRQRSSIVPRLAHLTICCACVLLFGRPVSAQVTHVAKSQTLKWQLSAIVGTGGQIAKDSTVNFAPFQAPTGGVLDSLTETFQATVDYSFNHTTIAPDGARWSWTSQGQNTPTSAYPSSGSWYDPISNTQTVVCLASNGCPPQLFQGTYGVPPVSTSFTSSQLAQFNAAGSVGGPLPFTVTTSLTGSLPATFSDTIKGTDTLTANYSVLQPLSKAEQFYNNDVIPITDSLFNSARGNFLIGAGVASVGGVVAFVSQPELVPWLFATETSLLNEANVIPPIPVDNYQSQPFVDPPVPLPAVTPGGIVAQTMASQMQQLDQNEYDEATLISDLLGLGSQIQSVLSNAQDASSLISMYSEDRSLLYQLAHTSAGLYQDLQLELNGEKVDLGITPADIQNYINSVETNGFPDSELPLLADLGLDPSKMAELLSGADFSNAPMSLSGLLAFNEITQNQLAEVTAPVPEPATIELLFAGLIGLVLIRRMNRPGFCGGCLV